MKATITSKGQITIPVKIRERLNLHSGDALDFDESAPFLVARPAFDEDQMRGALGCVRGDFEKSASDWLAETRGSVANPPEKA